MSIGAAFTGYLSQQNFDSQWISTQAKDGLNSVGVGAFFNVLNFGQMLLWHVLLLPVAVGVLIGLHLLLVRRRGVVRPLPARTGRHVGGPRAERPGTPSLEGATDERVDRSRPRTRTLAEASRCPTTAAGTAPRSATTSSRSSWSPWWWSPSLASALAVVFSSPDDTPVTIRQWAQADPGDFLATSVTELDGSSPTATYGPPYNSWTAGEGQKIGPVGSSAGPVSTSR